MFLAYDSGIEDKNRLLEFSSINGLDDLESSDRWACDGTFKVCSSAWYQLMSLNTITSDLCVLRLFALLPNKTKKTYHLFTTIKNLRPNCHPLYCMIDFEIAMHKAFLEVFQNAEVAGCSFLFGQSIWRNVSALGYSVKYNTDVEFQIKIRSFVHLCSCHSRM